MVIVWDLELPFYIIPGMKVSKILFIFLLLFTVLLVLVGNHIEEFSRNEYLIDTARFFCSWILMMSMMTCNGFVLLAMLAATLISRAILIRRKKKRSFVCC